MAFQLKSKSAITFDIFFKETRPVIGIKSTNNVVGLHEYLRNLGDAGLISFSSSFTSGPICF